MPQNGIQLLPESRKEIEVKIPGENRLLLLGSALLIIVIALFASFNLYASSFQAKIDDLDSELKALDSQRDKTAEQLILLAKDQFTTVEGIIGDHIVWSHILRKFQIKTSPQFQFKVMKGVFAENKADIEAEAANYTVVARQISSYLSEEIVKDVKLNEIKLLPSGRLSVNMKIIFDQKDILLKTISKN